MTPIDLHSISPRPSSTSADDGLPERLLTKHQAADVLGVCPRTIDNFIARRELRVVRLGRRTKIDPSDLRRFIDEKKG
jgi:excisionase family DNA binding protein